MPKDKTSAIEQDVRAENRPRLIFLLRLWLYVFNSARAVSLAYLGLLILLALLRPVLALVWGLYIDGATEFLPGGPVLPLVGLVAAYYAISFLSNLIIRYTCRYEDIERLDIVQANRFQEKVNARVFKKLADIDPEYWEVPKINDTVDRTMTFLSETRGGLSRSVMFQGHLVLSKLIAVASIAASLYIFNPMLCLIVLAAPLPSLYGLLFAQRLRFKFVKENAQLRRRADYFQDIMLRTGAKEVKTMGLFDFFFAKWKTEMDAYTIKEKRLYRNQTLINMSIDLVTNSVSVGATMLAIGFMTAGSITVGGLGACMSLIKTLLDDTKALLVGAATFLTKKNEAALFYDLMGLKDKTHEGEACGPLRSVEARGLRYRYPLTDRYALDGVDLTIEAGEKLALVGENGAGKTTFVKLLTATLSPSEGELMLNGKPAEAVSAESRFAGMSTVTQSPARYTTLSIEDNIRLGDWARHDHTAGVAASMAFAGLGALSPDTLLGKETGGTDISGGQWQKLAIARADYRNRDLIVLDEPTSNLDPLAETEVFKKYIELAQDKTVIFVTHRISVAALAQRIVVFEDGRVAEDGTHEALLAQNGPYARLYREQSKWYNR